MNKLLLIILFSSLFICSKSILLDKYIYTPYSTDQYQNLISTGKALVYYIGQNCTYIFTVILSLRKVNHCFTLKNLNIGGKPCNTYDLIFRAISVEYLGTNIKFVKVRQESKLVPDWPE